MYGISGNMSDTVNSLPHDVNTERMIFGQIATPNIKKSVVREIWDRICQFFTSTPSSLTYERVTLQAEINKAVVEADLHQGYYGEYPMSLSITVRGYSFELFEINNTLYVATESMKQKIDGSEGYTLGHMIAFARQACSDIDPWLGGCMTPSACAFLIEDSLTSYHHYDMLNDNRELVTECAKVVAPDSKKLRNGVTLDKLTDTINALRQSELNEASDLGRQPVPIVTVIPLRIGNYDDHYITVVIPVGDINEKPIIFESRDQLTYDSAKFNIKQTYHQKVLEYSYSHACRALISAVFQIESGIPAQHLRPCPEYNRGLAVCIGTGSCAAEYARYQTMECDEWGTPIRETPFPDDIPAGSTPCYAKETEMMEEY